MTAPTPDHEPLVHPPRHRGLLVALVATLIAVPLLVLDNTRGGDEPSDIPRVSEPAATVVVPVDRPATGPPKGVSVVTTSTTSSTLPLTTTTTSLPPGGVR